MKAYERFLKYAVIPTMSDEESESTPSSSKQFVLAKLLCKELLELGLKDARVDEHGYVYASLPSNVDKDIPAVGFISHMDTSPDAPDFEVKPRVLEYKGGDILLNEEKNIVMKVSDYPYLEDLVGDTLIVSDGTTLLGVDDKAGIAEIMTALEKIIESKIPHGRICIGFTPDEEIGRGANLFDVEGFGADYAYTLDGNYVGEIEYENFNAAGAYVKINGLSIHPGTAKGRMKNASLIAIEFDSLLPPDEIPVKTEGYEGFHHLCSIKGRVDFAELEYIIRDHDMAKFEEKKKHFCKVAEMINAKYGEGTAELTLKDSYFNMKEVIEKHMYIIDRVRAALKDIDVEPTIVPIRGGTDGARLSFMGLPCPNLGVGGNNYHSRFEYASVSQMEKASDLVVQIIKNLNL
ncbi:MAG: peptidase T [Ruminococcaceae bacterium]|nr:peptidase T [Oscillospiraceae bacterium]